VKSLTYKDFFLEHLDFAIEYISLHYPFTESQVIEYMTYLIKGSAFYSDYVSEIGTIITPTIGLSFNQNIQWTLALKRLWKVGYEIASPDCSSESGGYYDHATGQTLIWGNATAETLFDILPLDIYKEFLDRRHLYSAYSSDGVDVAGEEGQPIEYGKLTPQELTDLHSTYGTSVLYDNSIWNNTLQEVLTADMVELLIHTKKHCMEQGTAKEPKVIAFPDFHAYMEQMQPDHDKDSCYGAFNLYEYLWGDSNAGDNETLNALAEKWETSVKKISQHMGCVHAFLENGYPDVLRVMAIRDEQEDRDTDDDDLYDDYEDDDNDYSDRGQNSKYGGYNGWTDDAIDKAFEGDPEATWNVD
jgi:hypothetical protein